MHLARVALNGASSFWFKEVLLLLFFFLAPTAKSQHPPGASRGLPAKHLEHEAKHYLGVSWPPVNVAAVRPEMRWPHQPWLSSFAAILGTTDL